MPTKDFRADLREAGAPHRYPHLSQVKPGDYEGSISFNLQAANTNIEFQVVISDASDYPTDHSFGVFATSDNVPPPVTKALETAQNKGFFSGVSVNDLLVAIDRIVHDVLHNPHKGLDNDNDFDDSDQSMDDYEALSDDKIPEDVFDSPPRRSYQPRQKLQKDMRSVKNAGFKVGCLGETDGAVFVAISCRISKLGISEEAMQAWNLEASEYLVLLIRYPSFYHNMQDIFNMGDAASKAIEMRVGLCDSYKPNFHSAIHAFQTLFDSTTAYSDSSGGLNSESAIKFRPLFIGLPLERLLNERLLGILRIRQMYGLSWTGAEFFFHTNQSKILSFEEADDPKFSLPDTWLSPPPDFVANDHFLELLHDVTQVSFPLVAWQFTLRHLIKCTEFCLVCHCKTFDKFEALKPYVCSNELCLFQYMTYDMGPSLEHEIRSQPLVVDLLISLAWARANSCRLQDFPNGLGIQVPAIQSGPTQNWRPSSKSFQGRWNISTGELFGEETFKVSPGDWIVAMPADNEQTWMATHLKIEDVKSPTHVTISAICYVDGKVFNHCDALAKERIVHFVLYDRNFDDLPIPHKQAMICMLLNTLPQVSLMQSYLSSSGSQKLLSSCRETINPAALDILRWIVSSNRSCIIQDTEPNSQLVAGMKGYIQFRLVQGAPDKEGRFVNFVASELVPANSKYPTLFAWHGSPIHNWHSILREGLHFKEIANGRSFGNGVYMSSNFATALGYSGVHDTTSLPRSGSRWSNSVIDMQSVLSLNEVVNRTDRFCQCYPHFVVQQLDWIQPRYLFVGSPELSKLVRRGKSLDPSPRRMQVYEQDPMHQAHGPTGASIVIPLSAARSKQQRLFSISSNPSEIHTLWHESPRTRQKPEVDSTALQYEDRASVSTASEDINLLLSDSEPESGKRNATQTRAISREPIPNASMTTAMPPGAQSNFVPGTLKKDSLPLIPPPRNASASATKLLQKHLQIILKVQEKETLAELGWYIDPNLASNLYQWIVELHSFEPTLPLAKDLKARDLTSVVLEIRFPPNFPMNPPFVRVIRPRFKEFAAEGGGHVTSGGAMCMELLTSSGWSPVASMESVLLQVRMAISTPEPPPARLNMGFQKDYSVAEAVSAFKRACRNHGWEVPRDMDSLPL